MAKKSDTPTDGNVSSDAKVPQPKTYVKRDGPVYVDSRLYATNEPFTTSNEAGDGWEDITPVQVAAANAADKTKHDDPNFDEMDLSALQAYAATIKVPFDGLGKDDLITAIKAADEPAL